MPLRKIGLSPPSDVIIFIYMYKATCKYLKHVELCFLHSFLKDRPNFCYLCSLSVMLGQARF